MQPTDKPGDTLRSLLNDVRGLKQHIDEHFYLTNAIFENMGKRYVGQADDFRHSFDDLAMAALSACAMLDIRLSDLLGEKHEQSLYYKTLTLGSSLRFWRSDEEKFRDLATIVADRTKEILDDLKLDAQQQRAFIGSEEEALLLQDWAAKLGKFQQDVSAAIESGEVKQLAQARSRAR